MTGEGVEFDIVKKARHYNVHPSGVECIEVVRHMSFDLGGAVKYVWRATGKGSENTDLDKALFYIDDEAKMDDSEVVLYLGGNPGRIIDLAQRYHDAEEDIDRARAVLHLVRASFVLGEERQALLRIGRGHVQALVSRVDTRE